MKVTLTFSTFPLESINHRQVSSNTGTAKQIPLYQAQPLIINIPSSSLYSSEPDCPSLDDADKMSQTQLLKALTHNCRYDRLERPKITDEKSQVAPVKVHARAYIYFIQNLEAHDLQFKIHALLQFR